MLNVPDDPWADATPNRAVTREVGAEAPDRKPSEKRTSVEFAGIRAMTDDPNPTEATTRGSLRQSPRRRPGIGSPRRAGEGSPSKRPAERAAPPAKPRGHAPELAELEPLARAGVKLAAGAASVGLKLAGRTVGGLGRVVGRALMAVTRGCGRAPGSRPHPPNDLAAPGRAPARRASCAPSGTAPTARTSPGSSAMVAYNLVLARVPVRAPGPLHLRPGPAQPRRRASILVDLQRLFPNVEQGTLATSSPGSATARRRSGSSPRSARSGSAPRSGARWTPPSAASTTSSAAAGWSRSASPS